MEDVPGITGTEDGPRSIGLRGDRLQTTRVALSRRAVAILGEGQESECGQRSNVRPRRIGAKFRADLGAAPPRYRCVVDRTTV